MGMVGVTSGDPGKEAPTTLPGKMKAEYMPGDHDEEALMRGALLPGWEARHRISAAGEFEGFWETSLSEVNPREKQD